MPNDVNAERLDRLRGDLADLRARNGLDTSATTDAMTAGFVPARNRSLMWFSGRMVRYETVTPSCATWPIRSVTRKRPIPPPNRSPSRPP